MAMIIAKIIVFTVNFVLWASGILLIVFGGIALGSPTTIVNLLDLVSGVSNVANIINVGAILEGMAIFMIVVGSFLFIFGGVGCHGFHRRHEKSIKTYSVMLFLGILAEIGVIIYGGVYPGTAEGWIQSQMYTSLIGNFTPVAITNNALIYSTSLVPGSWEYLQTQTQCCGAYGPSDYAAMTLSIAGIGGIKIPPTCCVSTLPAGQAVTGTSQFVNFNACIQNTTTAGIYYYTQGCYNVTMNMLWNFDYIAMIIAGCLIAAQILAAIFTIHTWHRIIRGKEI